jgi:hypothetical protein
MKTLKNLFQRTVFRLSLPGKERYTAEVWFKINNDDAAIGTLAWPIAYCGLVGIELAFESLSKRDPRNVLVAKGLQLIAGNPAATIGQQTLIATNIADWFARQANESTVENTDEAVAFRLARLFWELRFRVDETVRVQTWLRIISTIPGIATDLPFEIAQLTHVDSPWWPLIYDLIQRPETIAPSQTAEAGHDTSVNQRQREETEALAASIVKRTPQQDINVPTIARFAFRHRNPRVRMYLIQALANLPGEAGRGAIEAGLEDPELEVRLYLATSLEDNRLPLSNSIPAILELAPDAPEEVWRRAQNFILVHNLDAVPGLVSALNPNTPLPSATAINLLYLVFKSSMKSEENTQVLLSAFGPYVANLASILTCRWVNGRVAGRLAYMIAFLDKDYLVPPPASEASA